MGGRQSAVSGGDKLLCDRTGPPSIVSIRSIPHSEIRPAVLTRKVCGNKPVVPPPGCLPLWLTAPKGAEENPAPHCPLPQQNHHRLPPISAHDPHWTTEVSGSRGARRRYHRIPNASKAASQRNASAVGVQTKNPVASHATAQPGHIERIAALSAGIPEKHVSTVSAWMRRSRGRFSRGPRK